MPFTLLLPAQLFKQALQTVQAFLPGSVQLGELQVLEANLSAARNRLSMRGRFSVRLWGTGGDAAHSAEQGAGVSALSAETPHAGGRPGAFAESELAAIRRLFPDVKGSSRQHALIYRMRAMSRLLHWPAPRPPAAAQAGRYMRAVREETE